MFPGMGDPRQMKKMMQQLGIKTEEIAAKKVILELEGGGKLVFDAPQITAVNMGAQKMYSLMGNPREEKAAIGSIEIPAEDIEMVAGQTGASKAQAKKALEKHQGDLAEAIAELKKG